MESESMSREEIAEIVEKLSSAPSGYDGDVAIRKAFYGGAPLPDQALQAMIDAGLPCSRQSIAQEFSSTLCTSKSSRLFNNFADYLKKCEDKKHFRHVFDRLLGEPLFMSALKTSSYTFRDFIIDCHKINYSLCRAIEKYPEHRIKERILADEELSKLVSAIALNKIVSSTDSPVLREYISLEEQYEYRKYGTRSFLRDLANEIDLYLKSTI
jgi:hypothetical protein